MLNVDPCWMLNVVVVLLLFSPWCPYLASQYVSFIDIHRTFAYSYFQDQQVEGATRYDTCLICLSGV